MNKCIFAISDAKSYYLTFIRTLNRFPHTRVRTLLHTTVCVCVRVHQVCESGVCQDTLSHTI